MRGVGGWGTHCPPSGLAVSLGHAARCRVDSVPHHVRDKDSPQVANQPARGPRVSDPKGWAIPVRSGLMGDISAGIGCPVVHGGPAEEGASSRALWQLGKPFNVPLAQHGDQRPGPKAPGMRGGCPGWGLRVQGAAPSPGTQAAGRRPGLVFGEGQARSVPWVWAFPCEAGASLLGNRVSLL